jgi:hypothetical protein
MRIPDAATIEIVELRRDEQEPWPPAHGVVCPNQVLINGTPVLMPLGAEVVIHDIKHGEPLTVTLTLHARAIIIGAGELQQDEA